MTSTADWLVVAGFLLCVMGVALRIAIMMMRASETMPANATPLPERNLMRAKPKGKLPLVMWLSICSGLILLVAGLLLEFH